MLNHLAIPQPDELFYSIVARSAWRFQIGSSTMLSELLFGYSARHAACPDLPSGLSQFTSRIPPAHPLSQSNLLHNHTLFPLYEPFMPPERAELLATKIQGTVRDKMKFLIPSRIKRHPDGGLRACPSCLAEDMDRDGELRWRRLHNVPGVVVCPIHRVFLVSSGVTPQKMTEGRYLMPNETLLRKGERLSPENAEHSDLLLLAQHARWLLDQHDWRVQPSTWIVAYRSRLAQMGFREGRGEYNIRVLVRTISERFPAAFLARIGVGPLHDSWLWRLITEEHRVHAPWQHFLFWMWLGLPPGQVREGFLDSTASPTVGVKTPYATKRVINSRDGHKLLRVLWMDSNISLRQICFKLQAGYLCVMRHARIMKLPIPRPGRENISESARLRKVRDQNIKRWRSQWLKYRAKHPEMNRSELRIRKRSLYAALYRVDDRWLNQHMPKRYSTGKHLINWAKLDDAMLVKLKAAHVELVNSRGAKRISKPNILQCAGMERWSCLRAKRMPKSARFLKQILESSTQYVMRRLRDAAERIRANGGLVHASDLVRSAKVYRTTAARPGTIKLIKKLCSRPHA